MKDAFQKIQNTSPICTSSLHRGHANLTRFSVCTLEMSTVLSNSQIVALLLSPAHCPRTFFLFCTFHVTRIMLLKWSFVSGLLTSSMIYGFIYVVGLIMTQFHLFLRLPCVNYTGYSICGHFSYLYFFCRCFVLLGKS